MPLLENPDEANRVFILGCERSGSTWLTNIIDSHPEVCCFMEPFADYATICPGFPTRNMHLRDNFSSEFLNYVNNCISKLYKIKYGLFYKPGNNISFKKVDFRYRAIANKLLRYSRLYPSQKLLQHELLSLNQKGNDLLINSEKSTNVKLFLIKELRLNFKVFLLKELYPTCKVLVIIRDPSVQIASVLKLFNKGHLNELRRNLTLFSTVLLTNRRFERYKNELQNFNDYSLIDQLVVWWLINYEVLIEDLIESGLDFKIVYHEDLSSKTDQKVEELFSFVQMNLHGDVKKYTLNSSTNINSKKARTNTSRNSIQYYKQKISEVDNTLQQKIYHKAIAMKPISEIADVYFS